MGQRQLFSRKQLEQPRRRGRPKKADAGMSHQRRSPVDPRHPHHVTVRVRRGVWNLRSQRCFRPIAKALETIRDAREDFRVVHFSVQGNHVHLVTEAADRRAMTQGMRALLIRVAKRLNKLMGTSGRVFADRFHERILRTRREVANVVRYVLQNAQRHYGASREPDRFSSALVSDVVAKPGSWLLRMTRAQPP